MDTVGLQYIDSRGYQNTNSTELYIKTHPTYILLAWSVVRVSCMYSILTRMIRGLRICYSESQKFETKYSCEDFKVEKTKSEKDDSDTELSDLSFSNLNGKWWNPQNTHLTIYTVPRYPENHNPLLPLSLQQRLDDMSPKEFLTYVLKELTLEERESLMVDERQRRKTFLVNWPYDDQRSGVKMAQAGFYSLNCADRVQCVFCRGSLHQWSSPDTPMVEHARSFNFCRFVKGLECGNREYKSNMLSEDDIKNITRFYKPTGNERQQRTHSESVDGTVLGISTNKAALIRYAPGATRIRTFARWPASSPITAQKMCEAGFYFTGFEDQVRCFFCAGGIKQWRENDDPSEEHARWFPDCAFLIQQKGQGYVEEVHAKTPNNMKSVRKTQAQKSAETKQNDQKTIEQDMQSICLKLGYTKEDIDRVLEVNGKPFNNISMIIDALNSDEVEDCSTTMRVAPRHSTNSVKSTSSTCPEEDRHKLLVNQDGASYNPGTFNGTEIQPKYQLGCRKCEMTTEGFVPATHVGLPCGHLIYCDSCNSEEKRKASFSNYQVKCPAYKCGALLKGSIKVYFS